MGETLLLWIIVSLISIALIIGVAISVFKTTSALSGNRKRARRKRSSMRENLGGVTQETEDSKVIGYGVLSPWA